MSFFRVFFALACLVLSAPASANDVPERVEAAFRAWMADVGADKGVFTLWRGGEPVHEAGIGMSPDTPVELASLSKAITAVCALSLIDEETWRPETSASDVLGMGEGVTIAGLMTHSAGLAPDGTQRKANAVLPVARKDAPETVARALSRDLDADTIGKFFYNNENYAVLAAMIEAETGQPYAQVCTARALEPAGATGAASELTGPMQPWGGWSMTVGDYAAFLNHWYGPQGAVGADPARWPRLGFEGDAYFYGPGMFQRPMRGTNNFWHFGSHCFPGKLNAGAFAVSWFGDWSLVAAYDACLEWEQMIALDNSMASAVFGAPE